MNDLDIKLDDAINRDDLKEVTSLLEQGANIESVDSFGCTPLMNAAWIGSSTLVNFLLAKGAKTETKDNEGFTALEKIKEIGHNNYGHDKVIRVLEENKKRKT